MNDIAVFVDRMIVNISTIQKTKHKTIILSQCLITDWNAKEETDHTIVHVEEAKWTGQEARRDNNNMICHSVNLIVCENHNISVLLSICYKTTLSSFGIRSWKLLLHKVVFQIVN